MVWDIFIVIASVSFMTWVIPIQTAYLTMEDMILAKKRKQVDEDTGIEYYCSMSMYDINNALTEKSLPLSDIMHGP